MPRLEILVEGTSSLHHVAERGILFIDISSEGPHQESVSQIVTTTSNQLRQNFHELAPKSETSEATPDAPITKFSMGSVKSWSHVLRDKDKNPLPRQYSTRVSFEVIFRDFEKLGDTASSLFAMPYVQITKIEWRLTDQTKENLASESRKAAMWDAIRRADDYAGIVRREVIPVLITDSGLTSGTRTKQAAMRSTMSNVSGSPLGLALEPEDVELRASVRVKFVAE